MNRYLKTLQQIADLPKTTNHDDTNEIIESYFWAVFWANEAIEELREKRLRMNSDNKPSIDWGSRELGYELQPVYCEGTLSGEDAKKVLNDIKSRKAPSKSEIDIMSEKFKRMGKRGDYDN